MVVPGLYGYVSATKWVVELKLTRFADEQGYWTPRGWSALGPVKLSSRIDVPKAFQALPFMQSGGARALGWGPADLALLCASHNGEPMHVAQAERMLASVGKDYHALRCGCHDSSRRDTSFSSSISLSLSRTIPYMSRRMVELAPPLPLSPNSERHLPSY